MYAPRRVLARPQDAAVDLLCEEVSTHFTRLARRFRELVLEDAGDGPSDEEGEVPVEFEACVAFSGTCSGVVVLRFSGEGVAVPAGDAGGARLLTPEGDAIDLGRARWVLGSLVDLLLGDLQRRTEGPAAAALEFASTRPGRSADSSRNHAGSLVHKRNDGLLSLEVWTTTEEDGHGP